MPARTILLVEDEALIALSESRQLEAAGYAVVQALSGERAVEIMEGEGDRIDLVLMDIDLGRGMDGTQAALEIQKKHDTPILFLSSHQEKTVVERTERITNYGYMVKNSSFTVLDASIKMAFRLFEATRKLGHKSAEAEAANTRLVATVGSLEEANRKLALSEEKFSKAFFVNPDYIAISRLEDGRYVDVNPGFTLMTGYTREEVIGRSALADLGLWVRPEDRKTLVEGLRATGEVTGFETEFRRKDGGIILISASARVLEVEGEACFIAIVKDITAQRQKEEELARARLLLDSVLASPHDVEILSVDRDLCYLYCNRAYRESIRQDFGVEVLPGMSLLEAVPADPFRDESVERYRQALAGAFSRVVEKDGRNGRIFETSYSPIMDGAGRIIGAAAFAMDITKGETLSDRLRDRESDWETMISASPDGIVVVSLTGDILFASPRCATLFGHAEASEAVGKSLLAFLHPSELARAGGNLASVIAGSGASHGRYRAMRRDGSTFLAEISTGVVRGPDSRPSRLISIIRDVTGREEEEKALKESEARYRSLLGAIGEGFCHTDADNRFILVNASGERIFGVPEGGLLGRSVLEFTDAEGRAKVTEEHRDRSKGVASTYTMPIIRQDGQRRWLRVIASPVNDAEGRFVGSSVVFDDITERLAAEEDLKRQIGQNEILMRELQHRVKNSLAIASSLVGIVSGEIGDARTRELLSSTILRIDSMSRVYDRLSLSQNPQAVEFGGYLEDLVRSIHDSIAGGPGRISLEVEAARIELDAKRAIPLGIILNELVTNAMKHAFPEGRSGRLRVFFGPAAAGLELGVEDDGVGMEAEDGAGGRGQRSLGMSLVGMLASQVGGSIEVRSGPAGTRAVLRMPR
jgi:PAS domain S-box-containing protein